MGNVKLHVCLFTSNPEKRKKKKKNENENEYCWVSIFLYLSFFFCPLSHFLTPLFTVGNTFQLIRPSTAQPKTRR
jgi:hypothetical protein